MDAFSEFVWNERGHYEADDNNRFAFSIGHVFRYLSFLELCLGRHDEASVDAARAFQGMKAIEPRDDGSLGPEDERIFDQLRSSSFLVEYEVECFFLFAKILLDKASQFVWDYFGKEQGMSLRSHDRLAKHLAEYARRKQLTLSDRIIELAGALKLTVVDYRDKQITHLESPRSTKGISFNNISGRSSVFTTRLYPKDTDPDQVSSTPIPEVMDLIGLYLQELIRMIQDNRARSRFRLVNAGE